MINKYIDYLIIILFCISIFIPLAFSDFKGGTVSETEKRTLASFPEILSDNWKLLPGIRSGIENWINDNVGFRTWANKTKASIEIKIFHNSPNQLVHIGKKGWLFYTGDKNLEIASGNFQLSPVQMENIKKNQIEIQRALKKQGIEYVIVFIPSKASVYPEYIGGKYTIQKTLIDMVSEFLLESTSIPIINLKPDLLRSKEKQLIYYKTDTHWNMEGAYLGYTSIFNHLNLLGITYSTPIEINRSPAFHVGDLTVMLNNILPPEPYNSIQIVNQNSMKIDSGPYYDSLNNLIQKNGINNRFFYIYYIYKNPVSEKRKIVIYGDSFFGSSIIPQLFAENFSETVFIWSYQIMKNELDLVKPDLVILEVTERYIPSLEMPPDPQLSDTLLHDPKSEIISSTLPSSFISGEKYNFSVTVRNNGTETWNSIKQIKLCIFFDDKDIGYHINIPPEIEIKPGDVYTFLINDFPSPPNGTKSLEIQMAEDGIQYFGEKQHMNITIR